MTETRYQGRRAKFLENNELRVAVLEDGGHIAEIYDKAAGVNPLWTPPWQTFDGWTRPRVDPAVYGDGSDARLLAGIMGHNVCLDIFGPPSEAEAKTGLMAHGEAPVARYELTAADGILEARARLPIAGLDFERRVSLRGRAVAIREKVVNVSGADRAIGWTQHVTLGPPFLECGSTQFRASATRSRTFEVPFGADDYLMAAADFDWPLAPGMDGRAADLRLFGNMTRSSAYTAHLMGAGGPHAYFMAFAPAFQLAIGYIWKAVDYPWMGIWEENHSRMNPPWNGRTLARGMEFGVSPMPETREAMVRRGTLFGVPTFRRIASGESIAVEYYAVLQRATVAPDSIAWPGV